MDLPRKQLIQMAGAPGSGKTTLANLLAKSINGIVIEHDLIKTFFLENDIPFEQAAKLTYRFQWVLAEDIVKQGRHVIMDSPCNSNEVLERGLAIVQKYGCDYRYVECRVQDIDLLDQRISSRVPMRSQRRGVYRPPPDATGVRHHGDYVALFQKWQNPCRPNGDIIVVDSRSDLEGCLDCVLKRIATPTETPTS